MKSRWPLAASAAGVLGALSLVWLVSGHRYDFALDWLSAHALIQGANPYQPIVDLAAHFGLVATDGYIHPRTPGALMLLAPIGLIPLEHAYGTGRVLVVASAFALAWVFSRLSGVRLVWCMISVPVLLLVWPFSGVLALGQSSLLVAALIGLTWLAARHRDSPAAGVPLAVAVTLKLWPWLLVPALWWSGYRRTAAGALGAFTLLNLAGLALPHVTLEDMVYTFTEAERVVTWSMSLGVPTWAGALVAVLVVFALRRRDAWQLFSVAIGVGLLFAPILWPHYLVALVIPAGLIAWHARVRQRSGSSAHPVETGTTIRHKAPAPNPYLDFNSADRMGRSLPESGSDHLPDPT